MLKDKLMKHLNKKGAKDLDPMEKDAKMGVIGELHKQASSMLHGKVHPGAGKVTVASNSKEGLHHGLLKADELLKHSGGDDSVRDHTGTDLPDAEQHQVESDQGSDALEGSPEEEANEPVSEALDEGDVSPADSEHDSDLEAEHADKSPEEMDAHIKKLMALHSKKKAGLA